MAADEEEKAALQVALSNIAETSHKLIQDAKEVAFENTEEFVSKKISKLFQIVKVYKTEFERLNVATKEAFERKARPYFRDRVIREAFDEMADNENEWDDFLKDVDTHLVTSGGVPLGEGDAGPVDDMVVDVRSGKVVPLSSYLDGENSLVMDEISEAGGKILMVSFGEKAGAEKWIEQTKCPFDMVVDGPRKIYHSFGLYRSVYKVWSISCMVYYAEQVVAGRTLPTPFENVHDDPQQMGGDFILNSEGKITLSYCSKTASDRPSVDHLLSVLCNLSTSTTTDATN